MLESRWGRRLGPGIAALAGVLAIASTTVGAPPADVGALPSCRDGTTPGAATGAAAWYRLDPVLVAGARQGQRLDIGRIGGSAWTVTLDSESFASAPARGRVVFGTDDGRRSTVSVADVARGCSTVVATSTEVIRHAVLAPDGATLYEFRVRRTDRADLGVWRRTPGRDDAARVLGPIGADAAFGMTWTTDLTWSSDGGLLAVTSCGEVACRIRILDPVTGRARTVADPRLGALVGLAGERLVVHGACRGLPCPLFTADLRSGATHRLADAAGLASVVVDGAGQAVTVYEVDGFTGPLVPVALDGGRIDALPIPPDGYRIVGPRAAAGAETPPGWLLLGPDGRLPAAPGSDARAQRLADGQTRRLDEVAP